MKSKIIFLSILLTALFLSGCKPAAPEADTAALVNEESAAPKETAPENAANANLDDHACVLPDGYKWCEAKQKCIKESEEKCKKTEGYLPPKMSYFLIEEALADKVGKSPDDFDMGIQRLTSAHFRGIVNGMEGVVLAAKRNNDWIIVFDSVFGAEKTYSCATAETYGFPSDMIDDCVR